MMRRAVQFIFIGSLLLAGLQPAPVRAQAPDELGSAVLKQLRQSLEQLNRIEMRIRIKSETRSDKAVLERAEEPVVVPGSQVEVLYRRFDDAVLVSEILRRRRPGEFTQVDYIVRGPLVHYFADRLDEKLNQSTNIEVGVGVSLSDPQYGGTEDLEYVLNGLNDDATILGRLGYFPLQDYFGESATTTFVKEGDLVVARAQSPLGRIEAWLDPASGGLPRRIELRKSGNEKQTAGRRINEIQMNGNLDTWPDGGVKEIVWKAQDIEVDVLEGKPFIRRIIVEQITTSVAGPVVTSHTELEVFQKRLLTELKEEDFKTTLKIPVGNPVTIVGSPELNFKWLGN